MTVYQGKLINIDSAFSPLSESEVTAEIIEARVKSLSFKNFDEYKGLNDFIIDLCTCIERFWRLLACACSTIYFVQQEKKYVLVFGQSNDCGCIRTYTTCHSASFDATPDHNFPVKTLTSLADLYKTMDTEAARTVYARWIRQQEEATKLPMELVTGRMSNTSVEKSFIVTRGNGCVVCGETATCYAASTFGNMDNAILLELPVCKLHLAEAKQHPSTFSFFASLFGLNINDKHIEKLQCIPDALIPYVHASVAERLNGHPGQLKKTGRGWELWIQLDNGWQWLLRLGSFADFAYMLFEPKVKKARWRSDSAPDHPDLKFFPVHEHTSPDRKSDSVIPSFLYGHPVLDVKRFIDVGRELGAYR